MNLEIVNSIECFNMKNNKIGLIIGNFDGVHKGHQLLINSLTNKCRENGLVPVALTFNPHPAIFLNKNSGAFLINTYRERNELLHLYGISSILELNFNEELQSLSPEDFFNKYLFKIENLHTIYLGHDFSIGNGKVQAKNLLKEMVKKFSIKLFDSDAYILNSEILSSTLIRTQIKEGKILELNKGLNRLYSITGKVINGYGVGKKELVPTANIKIIDEQLHPKSGVYFTKTLYQGETYDSITNIGFRPSLKDDNGLSIETNIFNFSKDIYQENLTLQFLKFHREEIKFNSKNDLLSQIKQDLKAREAFND